MLVLYINCSFHLLNLVMIFYCLHYLNKHPMNADDFSAMPHHKFKSKHELFLNSYRCRI